MWRRFISVSCWERLTHSVQPVLARNNGVRIRPAAAEELGALLTLFNEVRSAAAANAIDALGVPLFRFILESSLPSDRVMRPIERYTPPFEHI